VLGAYLKGTSLAQELLNDLSVYLDSLAASHMEE